MLDNDVVFALVQMNTRLQLDEILPLELDINVRDIMLILE